MSTVVVKEPDISLIPSEVEDTIIISFSGVQGPKGDDGDAAAGTGSIRYHTFAYGDTSPVTLDTISSGKAVVNAKILIEQAFNGAGASLKLGDAGNAESVMAASDNDPAAVGTYETSPAKSWGSSTALRLTITPGSDASTGSGVVVLQIES